MKRLIILILIAYLPLTGKSQTATNSDDLKIYTAKQLRTDFVYFKSALETAHPSLYRYQSKDSVDAWFMNSLNQINHPMGDVAFWTILSKMVAKIESAHTGIIPNEALIKLMSTGRHEFLPFSVFIRNNQMYIKQWSGPRDTAFRMGDEIISINNQSAQSILTQLRAMLPGDGYSNAFKDYKIEQSRFRGLYNLIYGELPEYSLTYRDLNVVKTKTVKAAVANYSQPAEKSDENKTAGTHFDFALDVPDSAKHHISYPADIPSTAILKINEFTYEDDYESFHKKLFKELQQRKIENLVIDLRNNPGGQDKICIDLMSYLMQAAFQYAKTEERVVEIDKIKNIAAYTASKQQPTVVDFSTIDRKLFKKAWDMEDYRHKLNFKGRLYVLINHGSFSAATLMATAISEQRQCVLIGQETGGGHAGCDGGDDVEIKLPFTGFALKLPLWWTDSMSSLPNYGDGLKPDINYVPDALAIYKELYKKADPFIPVIKKAVLNAK